ncbi:MAG: hypothetical protein PHX74_01880 [Candidatus Sumerlaeales bacterium]|nr:hypothetical protein [Candidatus Sumerlaeales bacterium]
MTREQRDDARYEAIMIVNELHKTIDYSVYCRLIDLIDILGLPDETCTAEYPKPAQHEQVSPTTQSCPEKRTQNATTDACDRLRWLLTQAERVVCVEDEDRAAVDRACRLMADIDNGFDRVRR